MNPIMEAVLDYLDDGKEIAKLTVDKRYMPTKVIFEFADGSREDFQIDCNHATFMDRWKRTTRLIRLMGQIQPLENINDSDGPGA